MNWKDYVLEKEKLVNMSSNGKMSSYQMDFIFSVILFVVCIFIFRESLTLPKSTYEIVGTSFLPKVLCGLLCICSVLVFIEGLKKRKTQMMVKDESDDTGDDFENQEKRSFIKRPKLALLVLFITVLYIGLMSMRVIHYYILTPIFILVLGVILFRVEKKGKWQTFFIALIVIAIVLGVSLDYLFKNVFITDLF